jgi:phage major head subunit gpT-like protein
MSGVISTSSFAAAVAPTMVNWFGMGYKDKPATYERIFNMLGSEKAVERDVLASGLGMMIAGTEGEAVSYDDMKQGYAKDYLHTHYRLGCIITSDLIEDGNGLQVAEQRAKELGRSYAVTRNFVSSNVLNRAFNSTYTGGDGKELCATDHESRAGTFSNELATAADLSEAALEQVDLEMSDIRNDRGLRIDIAPTSLIVPRALRFEAHRILNSTLQPFTADNTANALKDMNVYSGGIVVWDYLTDADAFFVLTSENPGNGLKMFTRKNLTLTNDTHFDTDNVKFKGHARFSVGWTDPRGIYGSPGA